ncbi:MAG: DUF1993 domain-containing protein [Candidatus Moraniibacteriota bacterium]
MNLYDVSVPVFVKALENLKNVLKKGAAYAGEKGVDPNQFLEAKLAPDMYNLVKQVQIASDSAKGISARLAGMEPPKMEDIEKTFAELFSRIDKTVDFLKTLKPEQFEGADERKIPFPYVEGKYLVGSDSLFESSLPNFFFHVVTAYGILRAQGVPLGKNDYIGPLPLKDL